MQPPTIPFIDFKRLALTVGPYQGAFLDVIRPTQLLVYHAGRSSGGRSPLHISMSFLANDAVQIIRPELETAPPIALEMVKEIERRLALVGKHSQAMRHVRGHLNRP